MQSIKKRKLKSGLSSQGCVHKYVLTFRSCLSFELFLLQVKKKGDQVEVRKQHEHLVSNISKKPWFGLMLMPYGKFYHKMYQLGFFSTSFPASLLLTFFNGACDFNALITKSSASTRRSQILHSRISSVVSLKVDGKSWDVF